MVFKPEELPQDAPPLVLPAADSSPADEKVGFCSGGNSPWRPLFRHDCTFGPDIFIDVMINQIKNPNINSSWLCRADILHDSHEEKEDDSASPVVVAVESEEAVELANPPSFSGVELRRSIIRRLIPRNTMRDKPLDQTCLIYQSPPAPVAILDSNANNANTNREAPRQSLIVYLPHVSSPEEMPFYHPVVRGIAFLHTWIQSTGAGTVSVSYLFFNDNNVDNINNGKEGRKEERSEQQSGPPVKVIRTAMHLLGAIYKHGQGRLEGYQKRVHHDLLVPQARLQNTYSRLKQEYARSLIDGWAETTDPGKHVFEDLCIAAFLIELWRDMYMCAGQQQGGQGEQQPREQGSESSGPDRPEFPGFVDIGCGNGLLVYILNREGYKGWGFDARARKSWASYNIRSESPDGEEVEEDSLRQLVLLPPPAASSSSPPPADSGILPEPGLAISSEDAKLLHNGRFPKGTFIISNHADELTPWTPILATISDCPFIMIPCCSHDLTGKKFRAPPPKDKTKADSAYSSLVAWVTQIARDCGWVPEQEMLRIPSTRNTAVVGRKRLCEAAEVDVTAIVERYGGTEGYLETVIKLARSTGGGGGGHGTSARDKGH